LLLQNIRTALDGLHANGFAHCDLTLDNVFFDEKMDCFFLDDLEYLSNVDEPPPSKNFRTTKNCNSGRELDEENFKTFAVEVASL
jgi:hypothetical protein